MGNRLHTTIDHSYYFSLPQSRTVYLTSHSRPPTLPTAAWSYPSQACRVLALAPKSKSGPLEILKIFPLSREKKNDSTSQGGRLHNLYSLFLCLLSTPPTEYLDPFPLFHSSLFSSRTYGPAR